MSTTSITSGHDLKTLIISYHPLVIVETLEEDRLCAQLQAISSDVNQPFFVWTITTGLAHWPDVRGVHKTNEPITLLKYLEQLPTDGIYLFKDFAKHLEDVVVARKMRDILQYFSRRHSTILLSGGSIELPREIEHLASYYDLELPGEDELRNTLRSVLDSLRHRQEIKMRISQSQLDELIHALGGMTLSQARQVIAYCMVDDGELTVEDIRNVINRKVEMIREGGLLEYYPDEKNLFQLGGFEKLKGWLERARVGFSEEAQALNLTPPRGILIVGVQGCGKSLAAKVISRQWKMPLLKLDAGRLFDKYIGESEKNFRRAITLAESMAPVVLWIDEIEKGMSPSSSGEADGGLSRRLFGSFLTWMQEKKKEVFVVATANDLTILPPELLRKGRFDEIFFVDLPDPSERETIFDIHLNLRKQDPESFDLDALLAATEGFSGAEIEQAVIASLYRALHQKQALDTEVLLEEIRSTVPLSVSRREDIDELRRTASGRFVPVK